MPRRDSSRRSRADDVYDGFGYFQPSRPIPTDAGIKAKSERGAFAKSWWAKRWLHVLESFGWSNRLQRGRSYARSGQVLDLTLTPGQVKARVQGSQRTPYKVSITVAPLTDAQWEHVTDALAQQAIFAAQLLSGEVPHEIEAVFADAGVPLFPESASDIETRCSCPDYANPCKHIAAVYYLLGERFDEDPFLIFALRGRTQPQMLTALRSRRAASAAGSASAAPVEAVTPLADLLDGYYQTGNELAAIAVEIAAPEVEAASLRRLGSAPLDIDKDLRAIYRAMTAHALRKVFEEDET